MADTALHSDTTSSAAHPSPKVYYTIFGLLLVLLAVTVGAAEVDLGLLNFPIAATIASLKVVLIMLYFMHLRFSRPLIWLVAGAGFFWLLILFGLTFSDYATRSQPPFERPPPESLPRLGPADHRGVD